MFKSSLNRTAVGLLLASFLLVGCTTQTSTNQTTESTDGTGVITMNMRDYSYTPSRLEASPGETIKVKVVDQIGIHDFVIDELGVSSDTLFPGENKILNITIPADTRVGTSYEFYCSLPDHRELGMVGQLNIVSK